MANNSSYFVFLVSVFLVNQTFSTICFIEALTASRKNSTVEIISERWIPRNVVKFSAPACIRGASTAGGREDGSRCSIPCAAFAPTPKGDLPIVAWAYCPQRSLHFISSQGLKTSQIFFQQPIIAQLYGEDAIPEQQTGGGGRRSTRGTKNNRKATKGSATDSRRTNSNSAITLEVVPLPSSLQSGSYFPIGETKLAYEAIVVENRCSDTIQAVSEINGPKNGKQSRKGWKSANYDVNASSSHSAITAQNLTLGATPLQCAFTVVVHDAEAPTFTFCPGDRELYLRKGEDRVSVRYDNPLATDNTSKPAITMARGFASGNHLGPGRYFVEFVAIDNAGNKAYCRFSVKVHKFAQDAIRNPPVRVRDRSPVTRSSSEGLARQFGLPWGRGPSRRNK